MPINDDAVIEYVEINGEQVPKIVVPAEITITNTQTGKEYGSAKEADDDVDSDSNDDVNYYDNECDRRHLMFNNMVSNKSQKYK